VIRGIWGLPIVLGINIVPVEVIPMRDENSVEVVVRTLTVEVLTTAEVTIVATVAKEVVTSALVIVLTGKELVSAAAVNSSISLPTGMVVIPSTTIASGSDPPRMSNGPVAARTSVELLGLVN